MNLLGGVKIVHFPPSKRANRLLVLLPSMVKLSSPSKNESEFNLNTTLYSIAIFVPIGEPARLRDTANFQLYKFWITVQNLYLNKTNFA